MGKKPLLGLVGFCCVGLTVNGCESCGSRANGRKFQPAPLVQTKPAPTRDVASDGFRAPPRSMTATPAAAPVTPSDPIKSPPVVNSAVPTPSDPLTAGKPLQSPIQQTAASGAPSETMPVLPPFPTSGPLRTDESRNLNTTRKTSPGENAVSRAPAPPVSAFPALTGTPLPPPGTQPMGLPPVPRNSVIPSIPPSDLANEPPPVPMRSTIPPLPGTSSSESSETSLPPLK